MESVPAADRKTAEEYIKSAPLDVLMRQHVDSDPWLFLQKGLSFSEWTAHHLQRAGLTGAQLVLVGSSAIGFSLAPTKLGRPFQHVDDKQLRKPSDLDLALISPALFDAAWAEFRIEDQFSKSRYPKTRNKVYYGHIDAYDLEERHPTRRLIRALTNSIGKDRAFWGHDINIRIYRRKTDLEMYTLRSLEAAKATVPP